MSDRFNSFGVQILFEVLQIIVSLWLPSNRSQRHNTASYTKRLADRISPVTIISISTNFRSFAPEVVCTGVQLLDEKPYSLLSLNGVSFQIPVDYMRTIVYRKCVLIGFSLFLLLVINQKIFFVISKENITCCFVIRTRMKCRFVHEFIHWILVNKYNSRLKRRLISDCIYRVITIYFQCSCVSPFVRIVQRWSRWPVAYTCIFWFALLVVDFSNKSVELLFSWNFSVFCRKYLKTPESTAHKNILRV